ncbi:unnamed protein product [Rodentolepis nana]|uniref:MRG domain-containing protein n=1 Tax=Rodentolepis nana TaxID=102285 RepID=A0A0R3TZ37_RODNA|nr:unnamed protein product [Rodentolepis nana]
MTEPMDIEESSKQESLGENSVSTISNVLFPLGLLRYLFVELFTRHSLVLYKSNMMATDHYS